MSQNNALLSPSIQWVDGNGRPTLPFIQFITSMLSEISTPVLTASTVTNLPKNPTQGQMAIATDVKIATWGAVAVGSGANKCGVMFDSKHWRVFSNLT